MPIYEYECGDCGAKFELMVSRAQAKKQPACVSCGSKHTSRIMSGFFGRSGGGDGDESRSVGSSCAACSASSCAGCTH
jgi:putative FmdB family regulatory protein